MAATTEVAPLTRGRIIDAAGVLARAFHDDPLFTHLLPDGARRMGPLGWLARGCIHYAHLYGEVFAIDNLEGIAVWLTPHTPPANAWRIFRAGLAFTPHSLRATPFGGLADDIRRMGSLHSRDSQEPHWYLWFLGIEPRFQGLGFGSALLQPVLRRSDTEGTPCRLETFQSRNVRFYQRHGFDVTEEADMLPAGPHYWKMKREPDVALSRAQRESPPHPA